MLVNMVISIWMQTIQMAVHLVDVTRKDLMINSVIRYPVSANARYKICYTLGFLAHWQLTGKELMQSCVVHRQ